jgi:ribose-phosphate pyrophosphokinase
MKLSNNIDARSWDIQTGPLGIISLKGSEEFGNLVNKNIIARRKELIANNDDHVYLSGYLRDSFLISSDCPRFTTGEGKAVLNETIRGYDIYIIADIGNYSCTYKMYDVDQRMSPDDHYQDIKRIIAAIGGKARRISVIMPLLYESRQHKRSARESLDCAIALQELAGLKVDNIITFDAHDPRVQNAIPLISFENLNGHYQFIKKLLQTEKNLKIDNDHMVVVSPDEGGMQKNLYFANILGLDLSIFYKRRDYSNIINGKNPIISHEFMGDDVAGKDVLIADDILASGESILDTLYELRKRNAKRIFVAVTYAQFTTGIEEMNRAYKDGLFTRIYATNLSYRRPELLTMPWYEDVDMSPFMSYLIDTLNHDHSISALIDPSEKITALLDNYRKENP